MVEIEFSRKDKNKVSVIQSTDGKPYYNIRAIWDKVIRPYAIENIVTGISVKVPEGYELELREKSADFVIQGNRAICHLDTDEIIVPIKNNYAFSKRINGGDIIAEVVLHKIEKIEWKEKDSETPKKIVKVEK